MTTWNKAMRDALDEILSTTMVPCDTVEQRIEDIEALVDDAWNALHFAEQESAKADICEAGKLAFNYLAWRGDVDATKDTLLDTHRLLINRQRKYGHGNINKHGELGVLVRMSDKIARLQTGQMDFMDESYIDSWFDIVGYSTIFVMLVNETWNLPLIGDEA
jgi:hypothetical protein